MNFYDRIMISRRINYVVYWLIIGLILFLLGVILLFVYNEKQVTLLMLAICVTSFVLLVVCSHTTARNFMEVMREIELVVDFPSKTWGKEKYFDLFTMRTWSAKLTILFFVLSFLSTILFTGLPIQATLIKILGWILLPILLIFPGFAAYFYFYLLIVLHQIVRFPVKHTFYRVDHPSVLSLYKFYSNNTLFMLLLYIAIDACILSIYNPYTAIGIWIVILALYPLAYFILSFAQIHTLMYNLKQRNIDVINGQVVEISNQLQGKPTKETAEILMQLMDIQKKIENMREWPVSAQGAFTFLVATLTPIIQIGLSIWSMINRDL